MEGGRRVAVVVVEKVGLYSRELLNADELDKRRSPNDFTGEPESNAPRTHVSGFEFDGTLVVWGCGVSLGAAVSRYRRRACRSGVSLGSESEVRDTKKIGCVRSHDIFGTSGNFELRQIRVVLLGYAHGPPSQGHDIFRLSKGKTRRYIVVRREAHASEY
ncbi:hypothetical protein PHLCEN_2v13417 [Hermanssonia centrifuga]|uniref:Uncharacterized protein n=1 Tax=Hermanssonia centrifuga TaxID=98765 RepID=A0A2R6NE81_9APHY|nr:hypothetical protein PHLCEN_2v13417 [Hermanssonia centrifuga]